MKTYQVVSKDTITQEQLNDLLITAVEGGINYWCYVSDYHWDGVEDVSVHITDTEPDPESNLPVDGITIKASMLASVLPKLQTLPVYEGQSISGILEDMDAVTGDCAVQFLIFGDVIYG